MSDERRRQFWYPGDITDNTENARLIEKFLGFLPAAPVVDQLKERDIRCLYFLDLRCRAGHFRGGGHLCPRRDGGFWIEFDLVTPLDIDAPLDVDYIAKTVGHELCHTFGYDILVKPPERRWVPPRKVEEALCEEFAKRWLDVRSNRTEAIFLVNKVVRRGELWIR